MSLRRLVTRSKRRQAARLNMRALGSPRRSRLGAVKGGSLVQVGGALVPGSNVQADNGTLVRVQNVGRPSNALFASESQGNGVVVTKGGSGGGGAPGGGMIVHDLSGSWHTGKLDVPWTWLTRDGQGHVAGSNLLDLATRKHSSLTDMTTGDPHTQYVLETTELTAGNSLTGGGDLSADRTFAVQVQVDGGILAPSAGLKLALPQSITYSSSNIPGQTGKGHTHQISSADHTNHPTAGGAYANLFLRSDTFGGFKFGRHADKSAVLDIRPNEYAVAVNEQAETGMAMLVKAGRTDQSTFSAQRIANQDLLQNIFTVRDSNDRNLILITSYGDLESGLQTFVSGENGWQIRPNGDAEFNDVRVRGSLRASTFIKDEIHATNGTFIVTSSARLVAPLRIPSDKKGTNFMVHKTGTSRTGSNIQLVELDDVFTKTHLQVNSVISGRKVSGMAITVNVYTEWPASGQAELFFQDDVIRIKSIGSVGDVIVADIWMKVLRHDYTTQAMIDSEPDGFKPPLESSRYQCEVLRGVAGVIPKGAGVVRYGKGGDGHILMTADMENAPYISIRAIRPGAKPDDIPPNNDYTPGQEQVPGDAVQSIARLGRLSGISTIGSTSTEVGLAVARDFGDQLSPWAVFSNERFEMLDIGIKLNRHVGGNRRPTVRIEPNGTVSFGSDLGSSVAPSFKFDSTTGDITAGTYKIGTDADGNEVITGQGFLWDQSAGEFKLAGAINIQGTIDQDKVKDLGTDLGAKLNTSDNTWDKMLDKKQTFKHRPVSGDGSNGLFMAQSHLGFYRSNTWLTYMNNSGDLYMRGPNSTSAYLSWNSTAGMLESGQLGGEVAWSAASNTGTILAGEKHVSIGRNGIALSSEHTEITSLPQDIAERSQKIIWYYTDNSEVLSSGRRVSYALDESDIMNPNITGMLASYRGTNALLKTSGTSVNAVEILAPHQGNVFSHVYMAALNPADASGNTTANGYLYLTSFGGQAELSAPNVRVESKPNDIRLTAGRSVFARGEHSVEIQSGNGNFVDGSHPIDNRGIGYAPWEGAGGSIYMLHPEAFVGSRVLVSRETSLFEHQDGLQWSYVQAKKDRLDFGWYDKTNPNNVHYSYFQTDLTGVRINTKGKIRISSSIIEASTSMDMNGQATISQFVKTPFYAFTAALDFRYGGVGVHPDIANLNVLQMRGDEHEGKTNRLMHRMPGEDRYVAYLDEVGSGAAELGSRSHVIGGVINPVVGRNYILRIAPTAGDYTSPPGSFTATCKIVLPDESGIFHLRKTAGGVQVSREPNLQVADGNLAMGWTGTGLYINVAGSQRKGNLVWELNMITQNPWVAQRV